MKPKNHLVRLVLAGLMVLGAGTFSSLAQTESKSLVISVGEIRDVTVSFAIKGFEPGNRDIIKAQSDGSQKLSVTALKEGHTDLKVVGDGDQTETFRITVGSSLDAVLAELRKDLDNIPGVEAEVGLGKVVLRGIITKPRDWSYLKKTVLPSYGDQVQCKVQFKLQDEMLLKLKNDFEKNRFTVVEGNDAAPSPGTLNLFTTDNNVFINGSVYSQGELQTIKSVVNSCSWLTVRKEGDKLEDDACYAVVNVSVTPVLLEMDVCFVGVTDSEALQLGANLLKNGLGTISVLAGISGNMIHGTPNTANNTYAVNANIGDTIKVLGGGQGIGPTRFSSIGHLTFRNDATDWKTYKDGGTVYIEATGGVGSTATVVPVEYGYIIKAKGGLSDAENAALDMNVELSVPVPKSGRFELKQNRMEASIACPLGKTLILGGHKELTEGVQITSETPILGKIPGLQFLFSERKKDKQQRQVLTLVSVQMNKAPVVAAPVSDQTAETVEKAAVPLNILKPGLK